MSKIRIALPILVCSLITLGYAQPRSSAQQSEPKQEEAKHPQEANPEKPAERARESRPQEDKAAKPDRPEASKEQNEHKDQPKAGQEERREEHGQGEHQEDGQKRQDGNGRKSARIPETKFRATFGHEHSFKVNRVITQTTIVPNQTQFVYGGYSFVFLEPWPSAWMYTDDCYIDFIDDQYYLINPLHPEFRVSLLVIG